MDRKRIIILGAGLAGLSTAWYLQEKGIDCIILEKNSQAGGLCRSQKRKGFIFDYGGHLLHFRHKDKSAYDFVRNLLGTNLVKHERNSYIRCFNCDIPYPFQANFLKLPDKIVQDCLEGLKSVERNCQKNRYANFKAWAYAYFGKGIAEYFMIPYNEKFWTISADKLTCDWLDGFIPLIKFSDLSIKRPDNLRPIGYNSEFYYPAIGSIEELPLALEKNLRNKIYLNSEVTEINLRDKEITINFKQKVYFDRLVSSIPLPELNNIIRDIPLKIRNSLGLLNYNSILVFNLGIKNHVPSDKHWVYFPERKFRYFRIGFYSSFSSSLAPNDHSSVYIEVSFGKSARRINKQRLKQDIINDLIKRKWINTDSDIVSSNIIEIKYAYPIYDFYYKDAVLNVSEFLSGCDIYPIGRYGSWRYLSMEDAILDGKRTAELFI